MDSYEEGRNLINEILKNSSSAERSEFARRLRSVISAKTNKYNLNKNLNTLHEYYQDRLKRRNRTELVTAISIPVFFFANYFLNSYFIDIKNVGFFVIAAVVFIIFYKIENKISDSEYLILHRNYEFEINRYQCDVDQYGYFLTSDSNLFFEYDGSNEAFKNVFVKATLKAHVELELAILNYMFLVKTT